MAATSSRVLSPVEIGQAAVAAGFPADQIPMAVAVALAESGGRPDATNKNRNGSTDYGLWQINSIHGGLLREGSWANPADNAKMAYKVWSQAGKSWRPWVAFKTGAAGAIMARQDKDWLTGVAGGVAKGVGDAQKLINAAGTATSTGLNAASNSMFAQFMGVDFLTRLWLLILGLLLIIVGTVVVFRRPIASAGKTVMNAVPAGRVANVASAAMKGTN